MKSSLEESIVFFSKLPGLGPRSARRLLLYLLKNKDTKLSKSIDFLTKINNELILCKYCSNLDSKSEDHMQAPSKSESIFVSHDFCP